MKRHLVFVNVGNLPSDKAEARVEAVTKKVKDALALDGEKWVGIGITEGQTRVETLVE